MSIVLAQATQAAQEPLSAGNLLVLSIGPLISAAIAYRAGVFRKDALRSPDRLGPDEHPANLGMILLVGLISWIAVPAVYGSYLQRTAATRPTSLPSFTPMEMTVLPAVSGVLVILVLVAGNLLYRKDGLRRLGLSAGDLRAAVPAGIIGIVCVIPVIAWASFITEWVWQRMGVQHPSKHEMLVILDQTRDIRVRVLVVLTATIIAPFYEELIFRGHIQSLLRRLFGSFWPAIVLASAAFALVHPRWMQPPIFVLALCLGWIYERKGNLWASIMVHGLFNATSIAVSLWAM